MRMYLGFKSGMWYDVSKFFHAILLATEKNIRCEDAHKRENRVHKFSERKWPIFLLRLVLRALYCRGTGNGKKGVWE